MAQGLDRETRRFQLAAKAGLLVAPLVCDRAIDRAVEEGVGWNEQEQAAPRREELVEAAKRLGVLANVLEHVEAEDRVGAARKIRRVQRRSVSLEHDDAGAAGEPLAQPRGVRLDGDHQ